MHDYVPFAASLAATLIAIFAGILLNRRDSKELRSELSATRTELKGEISALRTEVKSEISALRTEFKDDISALRTELKGDISSLRIEMSSRFNSTDSDLRRFYEITGELKGRVDSIQKKA